jgi:hypothetical protein
VLIDESPPVKMSHISNPWMIQVLYELLEVGMDMEFHELDLRILLSNDGTIRKSSNIILLGLKFRKNRYNSRKS